MSTDETTVVTIDDIKQSTALLRRFLTISTPSNASDSQHDHRQACPPVPWSQLWKLLNVFDRVIAEAQDGVVEKARAALLALQHQQPATDIKAKLEYIVANEAAERERCFALSVYWRRAVRTLYRQVHPSSLAQRQAVWRQLREKPADTQAALAAVTQYITSPEGSSTNSTTDSCHLRPRTASEAKLIIDTSQVCHQRLDIIDKWLVKHPAVSQYLRDPKGKGKAREAPEAVSAIESGAARAQTVLLAQRLKQCIHELDPPQRLADLALATKDWLDAFESRLSCLKAVSPSPIVAATRLVSPSATDNDVLNQPAPRKRRRLSNDAYDETGSVGKPKSPVREAALPVKAIVKDFQDTQSSSQSQSQSQKSWQETPPSPESLPSPPPAAQTRRAVLSSAPTPSQPLTQCLQPDAAVETQDEREASSLELPPLLSSVLTQPVQEDDSQETEASAAIITYTAQSASTSTSESSADITRIQQAKTPSISVHPGRPATDEDAPLYSADTDGPLSQPSLLKALSPGAEARLAEAAAAAQQLLTGMEYDPWDDIQWEVPADTAINVSTMGQDAARSPSPASTSESASSPHPFEQPDVLELDLSSVVERSHVYPSSDTNSDSESTAPLPIAPDMRYNVSLTSISSIDRGLRTASSSSSVGSERRLDQRVRDFLNAAVVD